MWLIRVTLTRTLIGFSLRRLATHTSFSSTNTVQLLTLSVLLPSETQTRRRAVANRHRIMREAKALKKGGKREGGAEEKKAPFTLPIKATQCAGDLHPV